MRSSTIREKCGVFGVSSPNEDAFNYLYWGLIAQNHRGHESYGFLTYSGEGNLNRKIGLGLVPKLSEDRFLKWKSSLKGNIGIAHVRYGTSGSRESRTHLLEDAQPMVVSIGEKKLGLAFNGNIVNIEWLRKEATKKFNYLMTDSDTELLSRYILSNIGRGVFDAIELCMANVEGAYSVVGLTSDGEMFAFKDPFGIRPLCFGCDKEKGVKAFSSETVGLNINGLELIRELEPGEAIVISRDNIEKEKIAKNNKKAFCAFEFAYFARPDSVINGKPVYKVREEFGRNLGKRYKDILKEVDLIISIPETSDDAAYGLHEETGIRWERALRRHRFVTQRAFILEPEERVATISRKINIVNDSLKGKKVAVIEDSIVRGDTTRTIIKKLKNSGVKKVYLFVTFPKITHPCFYGIDMATFKELVGFRRKDEEIAKIIGADAVYYQPLEDFVRATGFKKEELCTACITGKYPTELAQKISDKVENTPSILSDKRIYEITNLEVK
ncbi:MAG: amidophosphoribosyltransferase [Thermoproteota archaeon]